MKKIFSKSIAVMLASCMAWSVQAASVEIEWQDPQEYRDIRTDQVNQKRFEKRVMETLEAHFAAAAARYLPQNQQLHVRMTDVDLAGEVEYFHTPSGQGLRVVRRLYFPSLSFQYQLRGADGEAIRSGEEDIHDMSFLNFQQGLRHREPFVYEKRLINQWFREGLAPTADS